MSTEQGAMILLFLSGVCTLVAQSSVGAPIAPILVLIAGVADLAGSIFFGYKVAKASQRVQAFLVKFGLKKVK